jgi:GT2 family glycosyltransferase
VSGAPATRVTAVVLAYLSEPWLERCVDSILGSNGVEIDVVVVDNGCTDGAVEKLEGSPGVTIIRPGENLGFAGGCNEGARHATGDVIALVNGDAYVEADCLAALARVCREPGVGIATASVRLADEPERLNSAGNDIHFLGFSWSGRFNEPASANAARRPVLGASGAGCALERTLWESLGGFDEHYFAYHEDAELSLRCWHRGLTVEYVPDAVVVHRYEFSRNPRKLYLIERNRLIFLLTLWERRPLMMLLPLLLALEVATLALAIAGGWWREKLAGWGWLLRNRRWLRTRRALLQDERTVTDSALAHRFATRLDPGNYPLPKWLRPLDAVVAAYWRLIRRVL